MTNQDLLESIKSVEGYLRDDEALLLYNLAQNIKVRGVVVEIGSWLGKSTICLAKGISSHKVPKVYAIDPHTGSSEHVRTFGKISTYKIFQKNIKDSHVDSIVHPLVIKANDAVNKISEPIAMLFIDGAHDYESVKEDYQNWFPKLAIGGVIALHDTVSWPGPQKVVREFLFPSNHTRDINIVGSICYATKVNKTNPKDYLNKIYIRIIWELRCLFEKIKLPKPFHKLTKKLYLKLK